MTEARAFYLDAGGEPVFAIFNAGAADSRQRPAVLICPPWGWDEVASYRSRRHWAELLAAAGHPVLRIDLPGTGDSGGGPGTPGLLDRWVEAIAVAGQWLRAEAGAPGLALLGLGLGGLLAEEALARGMVAEQLVCWGAPASGGHFRREVRAFAALQAGRPAEPSDSPGGLPDGWLEAGGFLLSAETQAALKALEPVGVPLSRQVLLLGRDGLADAGGAKRLAAAGAEVSEDPGVGWGAFVAHPETTALSAGVEQVVRGWLARPMTAPGAVSPGEPRDASTPGAPVPVGRAQATFGDSGGGHTEEPVRVPEGFGDAFGILSRPTSGGGDQHCTVFLNAGAIRHIGPNRMWTEAARDLAGAGLPSLRVDLESIGEADGDPGRREEVADFYDDSFVAQVTGVLDWLERNGIARRFRLVGLCAGAYWAFRTGLVEDRIDGSLLLNSGALVWHPRILEERDDRRLGRVFKRRWWRMLVRREIKLSSALGLGRLVPAGLSRLARRLVRRGSSSAGLAIASDLDSLSACSRVVMGFSSSEPLREELEALGVTGQLSRWPHVKVVELPGADHTLRSTAAQRAARSLIEREVGQPGSDRAEP